LQRNNVVIILTRGHQVPANKRVLALLTLVMLVMLLVHQHVTTGRLNVAKYSE